MIYVFHCTVAFRSAVTSNRNHSTDCPHLRRLEDFEEQEKEKKVHMDRLGKFLVRCNVFTLI